MSFEMEFKVEIKDESLDEVLPQEECEHTGVITSDSTISDQCFYDDMGDLSIQKQDTTIKDEMAVGTPTPALTHYGRPLPQQCPSSCLSSIATAQPPHISQLIQSASLEQSIRKRGVEWFTKHIAPPRKFVIGWCDSRRAKAVIDFLESFANISRGSKYSRCYNYSIASNVPRILICEECSNQFMGLHDRFLKICRHYKTCHSRNCNKLIGQKLSKYHSTFLLMISAWQREINCTL